MEHGTSFYSGSELKSLGLSKYGRNVSISKKCSLYKPEEIILGNNVRIDDFCILSGKISVGSYVHIAAYCSLFGRYGITLEDFSGLSARVSIYTTSDNYLGKCLTNSTVPDEFKVKMDMGPVVLRKHVIVGCGSIIMPNIELKEGVAVGALSFVGGNLEEWGIYAGNPAELKLKRRASEILRMEQLVVEKYGL